MMTHRIKNIMTKSALFCNFEVLVQDRLRDIVEKL